MSLYMGYKRKVMKSKEATIQPFATKQIMADDSNREEPGSQGAQ
jgi:hypothetical protein